MTRTGNILLYPFSVIYCLFTGIRNYLYDSGILKSTTFALPVISVGNITVGGTGKTPHTEYLVELLGKYYKTATLSRGYRRKTSDFRIASPGSTVDEIGDEPLQISRKYPDALVAVDNKRTNGVRRIMELGVHPRIDVIILDDAFQHRSISPGISILLSDYNRPFIKDWLLPFGNLRESKSNKKRADIILVTKCPRNLTPFERRMTAREIDKAPFQKLFFTSLTYKTLYPVFDNFDKEQPVPDLSRCHDKGIVLVTGIADPGPFKHYLGKFFGEIDHHQYPDHYSFTESDIDDITKSFNNLKSSSRYLITTEKDAVRLRELGSVAGPLRSASFYIPVGVIFLFEEKSKFDDLILDYVRKNSRNS